MGRICQPRSALGARVRGEVERAGSRVDRQTVAVRCFAGGIRCRWRATACAIALVALTICAPAARAERISVLMTMGEYDTDVVRYLWTEVHVRAHAQADDLTVRSTPSG